MFSLIITVIAIALVAALALATIYYGGTAFNKSAASANAAKLLTQSEQVLAADRLYRVDHEGAMPASMQVLVDEGYLKTIPTALFEDSSNKFSALAASSTWQMIVAPTGRAYSLTSSQLDEASCKEVNVVSFGQKGVLKNVMSGFKTQCYGADTSNLTVLVVADPITLTTATLPGNASVVSGSSPASDNWTVPPTTQGGSSGGGNTPSLDTTLYEHCQALSDSLVTVAECTAAWEYRCTHNTPPTWTALDVAACINGAQISSIDPYSAYGPGCYIVNRNNGAGEPACPRSNWP